MKDAMAHGTFQHTNEYQKILLRRGLLRQALPGVVLCPYIGDGDLAYELYRDRLVYGADEDSLRVQKASSRLPQHQLRTADCDVWCWDGLTLPVAVWDIDSFANPYLQMEACFARLPKAPRVVIFGTDGMKIHIQLSFKGFKGQRFTDLAPIMAPTKITDINVMRGLCNTWWVKHVLPWLHETVAPWKITATSFYLRSNMLYWGMVVEEPKKGKQ